VRDGLRGLRSSQTLIQASERALAGEAGRAEPTESRTRVVLRDELYRVAMSEQQARVLQETAAQPAMSSMAEWIPSYGVCSGGGCAHGALRLHSGCQVIHVPSYLKGLWVACSSMCASAANAAGAHQLSLRWEEVAADEKVLSSKLNEFDAVILAAGSGLFEPDGVPAVPILSKNHSLPVQLVRGQSLQVTLPLSSEVHNDDAVLCGKYVAPLPRGIGDGRAVLIGATHEYQRVPLTPDEVVKDLRARTEPYLPPHHSAEVWDGGTVRRITSGVRVQSARGKYGRLPIIGRWVDVSLHSNAWIFTGLSSRGLLYHAMYGEMLAKAVLDNAEEVLWELYPGSAWWKADGKFALPQPS
jgi:glycine/D-amino acid oxidase-like deaminating enzyme